MGGVGGAARMQRRWMRKPYYICMQNADAQYSKKVHVCANTKYIL